MLDHAKMYRQQLSDLLPAGTRVLAVTRTRVPLGPIPEPPSPASARGDSHEGEKMLSWPWRIVIGAIHIVDASFIPTTSGRVFNQFLDWLFHGQVVGGAWDSLAVSCRRALQGRTDLVLVVTDGQFLVLQIGFERPAILCWQCSLDDISEVAVRRRRNSSGALWVTFRDSSWVVFADSLGMGARRARQVRDAVQVYRGA